MPTGGAGCSIGEPRIFDVRVLFVHRNIGTQVHFQRLREGGKLFFGDRQINHDFDACCGFPSRLVAAWIQVGFVHGVMNTDNQAISGETLDYGPCAFLDEFHAGKTFSSIDRHGRYAWGRQPAIAQWNLARLAECLLPLVDADEDRALAAVRAVVDDFPARYQAHWLAGVRRKLGLSPREGEDAGDDALAHAFLEADFSLEAQQTLSLLGGREAARDRVHFALGAVFGNHVGGS